MTRLALTPVILLAMVLPAAAHEPVLRTSGPIIYLADNLDEENRLGWCIDTVGRGLSDSLQTHSCKPDGAAEDRDVSFSHDPETGRIASATYDGKCAVINDPDLSDRALGLVDCEGGNAAQAFDYDIKTLALRPRGQADTCIVAGATINPAGPFSSRTLDLAPCAETEAALRQWVVLGK